MQRPLRNQPYLAYSKDSSEDLEEWLTGKLGMYLLDLEEQKELGT